MGANGSIFKRDVWERLGGFDERYGAGGEDRALAQSMLKHGIPIVREPLCSVFHSHGLDARNSLRQWIHWSEVGKKALPFETDKVHKRRPDLR
jgi:GT2 family glycosyltransferase